MKAEQRLAGVIGPASATVAGLALALAGLYPGNNPDTFGHLAQGRQIAELGYVPAFDTWSLIPGSPRPWLNYEWLSDLGTYLVYAQFGYTAVTLFKCLLLVITVLCLARTAHLLAGPRAVVLSSLAVISTIPAIRVRLSDRPHILGVCLAASYLLLLSMLQTRSTSAAALPGNASLARPRGRFDFALVALLAALHVLWVNAHGSHLLGLAITGSFVALCTREARRLFVSVFVLQLLGSCISPYGPAIWLDAIDHVVDPRYRALISEWQPWSATDPVWLQLGPALHGAILALLIPRLMRAAPSARAVLPVALLLGAACFRSIRFLAEFMLLTSPLVGIGLASLFADLSLRRFALSMSFAGLSLTALVFYGASQIRPHQPIGARMSLAGLPSAAGSMLRRYGVRPRVFAAMQDAWYLMFAAPRSRFVVDGRVPFYGPDYLTHFAQALVDRSAFQDLLHELRFNVVVSGYTIAGEQALGSFLKQAPTWPLLLIEDLHATYVLPGTLDDAGTREYAPITVLEPSYDLRWLLDADEARTAAIRRELAVLRAKPGTSGYVAWVDGVLIIAALHRGGPADGFRWPRVAADWELYRRARPHIDHAAQKAARVPVVLALQALLASIFCDFAAADDALEIAMMGNPSREPLMVTQELALRRRQFERVREVVNAARMRPEGKRDLWLAALADGIEHPPACPD